MVFRREPHSRRARRLHIVFSIAQAFDIVVGVHIVERGISVFGLAAILLSSYGGLPSEIELVGHRSQIALHIVSCYIEVDSVAAIRNTIDEIDITISSGLQAESYDSVSAVFYDRLRYEKHLTCRQYSAIRCLQQYIERTLSIALE